MIRWKLMPWTLLRLTLICIAVSSLTTGQSAFGQTAVSGRPPQVGTAPKNAAPDNASVANPTSGAPEAQEIAKRVNDALGVDLNATVAKWQSDLDRMETDLRRPKVAWAQLDAYRDELQRLHSEIATLARRIQSQLDTVSAQLNVLGPAPAAGESQPPQTELNRARLKYRLGLLVGGNASAESAELRVDDLLNRIEDIRRGEFASYLSRPIPGVYSYQTWSKVPGYVPATVQRVGNLVGDWWRGVQDRDGVARTGLESVLLFLILCVVGWRGVRRLRMWHPPGTLSFWRRASAAAGVILFRVLPVAVPVVFAYVVIAAEQPFPYRLSWLFYLAAESIVIVFSLGALVTTVFAPWAPQWRLIDVSDTVARRVCGLVILLAFVYSVAAWLYAAVLLVQAPFALVVAVVLPSSLLLAGLVVAILRTPIEVKDLSGSSMLLFRAIRLLVWIILAAIVLSAVTGYLALAHFLAQQLVVTGLVLVSVYLLLVWIDGLAQCISDDSGALGRWLSERGKLDQGRREQLALPVKLLLKLAVVIVAVPFIMLQWGYTWPDIEEWYRQLFFGFHIGNTQVTLGALAASVIVFAVGYAAARLFQGWLDVQVLQPAGLSGGVRHSIRTAVGYLGILIAALVAFSYAGFSLSSLAIVAGAFSIGIGFGLQNIVNNFVSGLILLVERPVRVGDLVIVGGEEGYVRKISVRSTELETFDRANVLIPNSAFISENVKNWTLHNRVVRITILVGAAYDCDPGKVRDVLLQVARDSRDVLNSPPPMVELKGFGASSIDFALYVFVEIHEPARQVKVRTDLSIAIFRAFAENGIGIPFTQADIRIRNVDQLREAIARSMGQLGERRSDNGQDGQKGSVEAR